MYNTDNGYSRQYQDLDDKYCPFFSPFRPVEELYFLVPLKVFVASGYANDK